MIDIKKDPVEDTSEYLEVSDVVDAEVNKVLTADGVSRGRGYIHKIWNLKKKILKEKYNIEWKTPAEMNPNSLFD